MSWVNNKGVTHKIVIASIPNHINLSAVMNLLYNITVISIKYRCSNNYNILYYKWDMI